MSRKEDKWLAVVNPHAGSGKTTAVWREAEKLLVQERIPFDKRYTGFKYHAREISYQAASSGYRKILSAGGDGTIHDALEGIKKFICEERAKGVQVSLSEFYLAVIPIGSGNDWIRIHHISHVLKDIVHLIKENSFILQDVVKASLLPKCDEGTALQAEPLKSTYMINIGGVGFDARICERVNAWKKQGRRGKMLYINSLLYNLFHFSPFGTTVICDGNTVYSGNCFSIALGTGKYSGGGLRQTPEAEFDDGLTDLTVIPPFPLLRVLCEAPRLFTGKLLTVKGLIVRRARSIVILPGKGRREIIEVDGEILGEVPVRFDVLPDQINVLHCYRS